MSKISDLKNEWMKDGKFKAEYDAMDAEFSLADVLIRARVAADMTQGQVAEKMKSSQSYVARLEGGVVKPTIEALKRYADATGRTLRIGLE